MENQTISVDEKQEKLPDSRFFEAMLNAFPSPIFAFDADMHVVARNSAAAQFFNGCGGTILGMKTGEVIHCVNSRKPDGECGAGKDCAGCALRASMQTALQGGRVTRRRCRMRVTQAGEVRDVLFLVTATSFPVEGRVLVLLVLEDISELSELKSLIPICAGCKKVRDDKAYWQHVECYLQDHLDLQFTHSLCPDCVARLYPALEE